MQKRLQELWYIVVNLMLCLHLTCGAKNFNVRPEPGLTDPDALYARQKHLGCKKVRGQSETTLLTGMCDQKL